MTRLQCQIPLGGLPINLVLVGNREEGKVVFVVVRPVGVVYDDAEVSAIFIDDGFVLFNPKFGSDETEIFNYDTLYDYKSIPLMLRWLQQQKLEQPV